MELGPSGCHAALRLAVFVCARVSRCRARCWARACCSASAGVALFALRCATKRWVRDAFCCAPRPQAVSTAQSARMAASRRYPRRRRRCPPKLATGDAARVWKLTKKLCGKRIPCKFAARPGGILHSSDRRRCEVSHAGESSASCPRLGHAHPSRRMQRSVAKEVWMLQKKLAVRE